MPNASKLVVAYPTGTVGCYGRKMLALTDYSFKPHFRIRLRARNERSEMMRSMVGIYAARGCFCEYVKATYC